MFDLLETERTSELRLHRFGRLAFLLMAALVAYIASTGLQAANRTETIEQDAAYYCAIAERMADGEGYNSLADRRGPAAPRAWPQPVEANSLWPAILGAAASVTGEARWTGTWMNLTSLALLVVLWPIGLWRILRVPGWVAVLSTAPLVLHREAFQAGLLPLTDGVSLLTNAVFIGLLMAGRTPWALPVLLAAVALRFQNVALMLPMAYCAFPAGSSAARLRWLLVPGALIAAAVYATGTVGLGTLWRGGLTALDPTDRDSLWRGIRFLSVPVLIGLPVWLRSERLRPLLLLGLGHLLVLATHADIHDSRPFFFAQRQGLPLHLVASGIGMVVLARSRGTVLWLSLAAALAAAGEHLRRPYRVLEARAEVTARPELRQAIHWLRANPLPDGAIALSHDADVLSWELQLRTVHTRAFRPGEDPAGTLANLRARGVTHAVLLWSANPFMVERNQWMDEFVAALGPASVTIERRLRTDGSAAGTSGFAVLRLQP